MCRLVALFVVASVVGCGRASVEGLSADETLDGIDVPRIATVGNLPDPARRQVVNVAADGRIVLSQATYTVAELDAELDRRAGSMPESEPLVGAWPPKYLSEAAVVLRVDGDLPCGASQRLIQSCAMTSVWRIGFCVRRQVDAEEGCLAISLPLGLAPSRLGCGQSDDVKRTVVPRFHINLTE